MNIYQMREMIPEDIVNEFIKDAYSTKIWNYGVPGGFLNNHPKRFVNSFGNGQAIDNNGNICSQGWNETKWTAKINQNNVTLHTKTESMPVSFAKMIPYFRSMFLQTFPLSAEKMNNFTFNIAVCNYYTDPTMNIAAHTDDNIWYPSECDQGPVFASITLYPFGKPTIEDNYARFQIYNGDKWIPIYLPHESIMIMPSSIKHRVQAHIKRKHHLFLPRINITFRSTYPIDINPLMNCMAVSNHTRYYKVPYKLSFPFSFAHSLTIKNESIIDIYNVYNAFVKDRTSEEIKVEYLDKDCSNKKKKYKNLYNSYIEKYNLMSISKYSANMTVETLEQVCNYVLYNLS